jgi:predicted Zn-dependent peptidase
MGDARGRWWAELRRDVTPTDEREKNDTLIESFTPEHINAVWRKYLLPDKLAWGIMGDQSKIK